MLQLLHIHPTPPPLQKEGEVGEIRGIFERGVGGGRYYMYVEIVVQLLDES